VAGRSFCYTTTIMKGLSPELIFSIANDLKEIPQPEWDNLFGKDLIESYGYQKTLEESSLEEFSFKYLIAKRGNSLVAVIPFFITEFPLTTLIDGNIHRIANKFRNFLKLKLIFMGSITTEEFYFGISKEEDLCLVMDGALQKISELCNREKISGITFYNLSDKNKLLAEYLNEKGFFKMESLPSTIIKIEGNSIEDYIKTLSRNTRKDLRKKLKKSSSQAQLITKIRNDVDDIIDEIYRLYMNNFDESSVHFEILTAEFFRKISKNMPGVAKFFITYDKEKIVAFNLCFIKGDFCIDKFIGLDSKLAQKYHLYFTTLYHNLDWCIKNGIRFYQPGATDYHPKIRFGAKLIPLFVYSKAFNPVLNYFLKSIFRLIEPKNLDSSFRYLKDTENKIFISD
jgi:predicted N-acyltransferase